MLGPKQTCTLQKNTPTATGTGSTASWAAVCSFQGVLMPVRQSEQSLADKDTEFKDYILFFDDLAVAESNHSEITNTRRILTNSRYYDIRGVAHYPAMDKHWELRLRDVTDQTE